MEKSADFKQLDGCRSSIAIRCAKAAILLSSLKSGLSNSAAADILRIQNEDLEIQKMQVELVKFKKKMKKLRIVAGIWLILYYLSIPIVLFSIALKFF